MDASEVLPNELWLQSFAYLSKTDLKALRLSMEPHLRSLASSVLFTTAYMAARKGVLDTFTNLTTHPVFRAYVKEIVFDSSWIHPATVAEYAKDKTEPALASLFQEQEGIQANELQIRLENAFQCLSGVKTVSYADLSRISWLPGDRNDPLSDFDYSDGPLIRRLESHLGPSEMGVCCLMNRKNTECPGHVDKFQYRRRFGGLVLLLQVLSDYASTTLQQLSLGSRVHACLDGGIPYWFLLSNTNIDTLCSFPNLFYNLRKFELSVSIFDQIEVLCSVRSSTQQHSKNFQEEGLANLLGLAKNLEEIKLTGDRKAAKLCFINILVNHKWARLRVLYLQRFKASASELEDFLKHHALSLQRMTLDDFHLRSGSWLDLGAIVPIIAPALEFILGFVSAKNWLFNAERLLPLSDLDLDISGPNQDWYDKARRGDDAESQVEDEDESEEESEDESISDKLEYSSDDSSPEEEEPRRKPDVDLLQTLDGDLRSKVEQLQSELPGCPVDECLEALKVTTGKNLKTARTLLMQRFGYTELDTMDPGMRASVERLMEDMPFYCDVLQCRDALRSSDGDHDGAREFLRQMYGYRQKIFMW